MKPQKKNRIFFFYFCAHVLVNHLTLAPDITRVRRLEDLQPVAFRHHTLVDLRSLRIVLCVDLVTYESIKPVPRGITCE